MTVRGRLLATAVAALLALIPCAGTAAARGIQAGGGPASPGAAPRAAAPLGVPAPARPLFGQQWSPWGRDRLGTSPVSVGSYGCALTASAMLLRTFGVDIDPGRLNRWLVGHGGYVAQDLLVWGAVARAARALGGSVRYAGWRRFDLPAIDGSLARGDPVIAQVSLDGNMHFVLIVAVSADGTMWINDPWFGDVTTLQARYGAPAQAILSIRLYRGRAVPAPRVTPLRPGGRAAISAPTGALGRGGRGSEVLAVPDTTPTTLWTRGTPATVASWTTARVRFTAPDPLSAGSLVVRTSTGQPNYWFPFTVPGERAVQVTGISPATGAMRGGTRVLIRGTGFIAPMTVRFGRAPARAAIVVSPTEILAVSPAATARGAPPPAPTQTLSPAPSASPTPSSTPGASPTPSPTPSPSATPSGSPSASAPPPLNPYRGALPAHRTGPRPGAIARVTLTVADWMGRSAAGSAATFAYTAGRPPPPSPSPSPTRAATPTPAVTAVPSATAPVATPPPTAPPVATVSPPASRAFHPLDQAPLVDTTAGLRAPRRPLVPGTSLTVVVAGAAGVPRAGATLVALELTVAPPSRAGAVAVAPAGAAASGGAIVDVRPGEPTTTLLLVAPGRDGAITLTSAAGPVELAAGVSGWFGRDLQGGGRYHPVAPTVVCDTHPGSPTPCAGRPLGPLGILTLALDGRGGVPGAGAGAVLLDITATAPSASGVLTVWPGASTRPAAADLSFAAGETVTAPVIAPLGPDGFVCVYSPSGTTEVTVQVDGWFAAG